MLELESISITVLSTTHFVHPQSKSDYMEDTEDSFVVHSSSLLLLLLLKCFYFSKSSFGFQRAIGHFALNPNSYSFLFLIGACGRMLVSSSDFYCACVVHPRVEVVGVFFQSGERL